MSSRPKHCRRCGKPATEARPISRKGNCPQCGVRAFKEAQKINENGGILNDPVARSKWLAGIQSAMARVAEADAESARGGV